jgi:hypothetical protein
LNNRTHNKRNENKAMTTLLNSSRNSGLIRKPYLCNILALALMGASLALFLCAAGGLSYGDPARSKPSILTVETHYYPTFGTPNDALVTADDAYVLVSVSEPTGVQVFRNPDFTNPCGGQQILNFPRPWPRLPPLQAVDGMQFFPGSPQVSVGAAVEAYGAEFFRLASLTAPCAVDGVINVQQYPVKPNCNPQNLCSPGTFDIAVTPDGEYAFVANEYGLMPNGLNMGMGGTIGVIRLERDDFGRFTNGSQVGYIYVPGGNTIPGITISHDGKYLYVTCEGSADGINPETFNPYRDPTNVQSTPNGPILCPGCATNMQKCDNESKGRQENNGLLTVIDVAKATSGMGQASIITSIASGCSPVRAVETENGQYLFVAARGLNKELPPQQGTSGYQILAFDVSKLVSRRGLSNTGLDPSSPSTSPRPTPAPRPRPNPNPPNDALVGQGDSGGTAPVGIALFGNNDNLLAVANSNRFYNNSECVNPPPGGPPCTASVAILDVSNPAAPAVQQIIPNANDAFPRNVTVGPDGTTLYVPNANARLLEVITTSMN